LFHRHRNFQRIQNPLPNPILKPQTKQLGRILSFLFEKHNLGRGGSGKKLTWPNPGGVPKYNFEENGVAERTNLAVREASREKYNFYKGVSGKK